MFAKTCVGTGGFTILLGERSHESHQAIGKNGERSVRPVLTYSLPRTSESRSVFVEPINKRTRSDLAPHSGRPVSLAKDLRRRSDDFNSDIGCRQFVFNLSNIIKTVGVATGFFKKILRIATMGSCKLATMTPTSHSSRLDITLSKSSNPTSDNRCT
jgi:hypothetical protein